MSLEWFLLLPLVGVVLNLIFIRFRFLKKLTALVLTGGMLYGVFDLSHKIGSSWVPDWTFMNRHIGFQLSTLGFYFILMIVGLAFLTVLFSWKFMDSKQNESHYYTWFYFKLFGMIAVVLSGDLLTFFLFWEVMSWSTYFLMRQGEKTEKSAHKYLIYAIASGMILLFAVMLLYGQTGSFAFSDVHQSMSAMPLSRLILVSLLLILAFSIEAAVWPLHQWVPDSYAETFTPITAFLAGISTRMGVFAIIFFVFSVIGLPNLDRLSWIGRFNFRYLFAWFAALTIVIPTFTALLQNDGKKLMTWHGIGQGGYMLLGLAVGGPLGTAGGLFHIVNHLTYISLILFSLAAVEYRTGTTNLNKLGGLIKKQPVAFLGVLIGIIGLAGIPPMNGFVSKWAIYRSLILGGYPFLATMAFIGTLGTILSVYKFIHNIFLGQLPEEYHKIREVPFVMQIPIWILMTLVLGLGIFPGIAFDLIAKIQISLGLTPIDFSLYGVAPQMGELNMMVVGLLFLFGLAIAFGIYLMGNRRRHISQLNNYAAGNFLTKETKYNFNYHFYAALEHLIAKKLRSDLSFKLERGVRAFLREWSDLSARIYTGHIATYSMYIFAGLLLLLVIVRGL